jgi:hypothetical protein
MRQATWPWRGNPRGCHHDVNRAVRLQEVTDERILYNDFERTLYASL